MISSGEAGCCRPRLGFREWRTAMTTTQTQVSGSAQDALWCGAAEAWATLMEPQYRALFDAVLADGRFHEGAHVLDIGCGSGLFAQLIAAKGCGITGVDAA